MEIIPFSAMSELLARRSEGVLTRGPDSPGQPEHWYLRDPFGTVQIQKVMSRDANEFRYRQDEVLGEVWSPWFSLRKDCPFPTSKLSELLGDRDIFCQGPLPNTWGGQQLSLLNPVALLSIRLVFPYPERWQYRMSSIFTEEGDCVWDQSPWHPLEKDIAVPANRGGFVLNRN